MLNNQNFSFDDNGEQYTYFFNPYTPFIKENYSKIKNEIPIRALDFIDLLTGDDPKKREKAIQIFSDTMHELELLKIQNILALDQLREIYGEDLPDNILNDSIAMNNDIKCESEQQLKNMAETDDEAFSELYGFTPSQLSLDKNPKKQYIENLFEDTINNFHIITYTFNNSVIFEGEQDHFYFKSEIKYLPTGETFFYEHQENSSPDTIHKSLCDRALSDDFLLFLQHSCQ